MGGTDYEMRLFSFIAIVSGGVLLAGCSGAKEAEDSRSSEAEEELRRYEQSFRPSDYDMDPKVFLSELKRDDERAAQPHDPAVTEAPVIVQGFRVQLLATTSIDEANTRKAEAEASFPDQWFYITFDAPNYKLRAGNFVSRADAEQYSKQMADQGFPDAWTVPDRVIKNIKPRQQLSPSDLPPHR